MKLKFGIDTFMFLIIWIVFSIFLIQYVESIEQKIVLIYWFVSVSIGIVIMSILEGNSK